uniref:Ig-like domain-containing protein n=1 Tax=Scophthalmus maximus TaxID=52904 RepID=A0A8D3B6K4_SCOMX
MAVSPEVTVSRGEDIVLNCSFTHPDQQFYSGAITVKWLARASNAAPFFSCSLKNDSTERLSDCSGFRYSLAGDPRRGELSLLIKKVELNDDGEYFCRVELDRQKEYLQKETKLHVTSEPQILSLLVVATPSTPDSATRRLQCEAEGHPRPKIVWLSASRFLIDDQGEESQSGPFRLISSVAYLEGADLTCRAENAQGHAERTYPVYPVTSHTLMIALVVSGLMVALLLSAGVIILCCTNRGERLWSGTVNNEFINYNERLYIKTISDCI